jgi:cytochrome b561
MRTEAMFQASFAMLHTYAAVLALVAVGSHLTAAVYHGRRLRRATQRRKRRMHLQFARPQDYRRAA